MTTLPVKTKLAIFDIDGTLTDSVLIHQQAFRQALQNAELIPYEVVERRRGGGALSRVGF